MITQIQEQKIKNYFSNKPVEMVYLFGSQAGGRTTPLSDYDFAVFFKEKLDGHQCFREKLKYAGDLGRILVTEKVDIVNLNQAPVLLCYAVVAARKEIVVRNERKRVDFEHRTLREYFDELYYLKRRTRAGLAKIAERGFELNG